MKGVINVDNKIICSECGVYTYHCECELEENAAYYEQLLQRLKTQKDTIITEDELVVLLKMVNDSKETRIILHPEFDGSFKVHVEDKTPSF